MWSVTPSVTVINLQRVMIHLLSTLYTCWFISTERNVFRTQQGINHNRRRPEKQNKLRRAGNSIALQFYKLNWEKWSWSTVQPVPSYNNFSFLVFRDVSECEPAREKKKNQKKSYNSDLGMRRTEIWRAQWAHKTGRFLLHCLGRTWTGAGVCKEILSPSLPPAYLS